MSISSEERYRHVGKFSVSCTMIENDPDVVKQILSKMIIVRAESMYVTNTIEYTAIWDKFSYVELGQEVPTYEIEIDSNMNPIVRNKNDYTDTIKQTPKRLLLILDKEIEDEM
jgi:hypothetical protein